jgi:hypothetical protein
MHARSAGEGAISSTTASLDPVAALKQGLPGMELPPKDSPLWTQMEDDVAAERWPVPSIFGGLAFWYGGPRNEAHRRATFKRRLRANRKRMSWLGPVGFLVGLWLLLVAFFVALYSFSQSHPEKIPTTLSPTWIRGIRVSDRMILWSAVAAGLFQLVEGARFNRSVERYSAKHHDQP